MPEKTKKIILVVLAILVGAFILFNLQKRQQENLKFLKQGTGLKLPDNIYAPGYKPASNNTSTSADDQLITENSPETQATEPTQVNNTTSTPTKSTLKFPTELNFNSSIFKTTSVSSDADIKAYVNSVENTTASFNLFTNATEIEKQFQTLNKSTLESLRDKSLANKTAIAKIVVPSSALGVAQRYYLIYDYFQKINELALKLVSGSLSQQEQQATLTEIEKNHSQLGLTMENLGVDLNALGK